LKEEGLMIKSMFKPLEEDWVFLQLDFSQLELRVAALMCADPKMAAIFKSGQDYHLAAAKIVAPVAWGISPSQVTDEHRSKVKAVVFGLLYGMTDGGLAKRLGCSVQEAARLRAAIFGSFPLLHEWYVACQEYAKKYGRCLTFWKGDPARRRPLFDIADPSSFDGQREYLTAAGSKARNAAVNTPVQGSASDFMLMALIEMVREIVESEWPARVIMSVHDSAIIECHKDFAPFMYARAKATMEKQGWGDVPIAVDGEAGPSWGELEKMEKWLAAYFGVPEGHKMDLTTEPRVRITRPDGTKTAWTSAGDVGSLVYDDFNSTVRGIVARLVAA
jgi:DNA polymerase-1